MRELAAALGFPASWTRDTFNELLRRESSAGSTGIVTLSEGSYLRYAIGAGIELWLAVNTAWDAVGLSFHFAGKSSVDAAITRFYDHPDRPMSGSMHIWCNQQTSDPESGIAPLVCNMPDALLVHSKISPPARTSLQIAGFALEASFYPDDAAYLANQQGAIKFAPEYIIPNGLFEFEAEPGIGVPRPTAMIAGHIEQIDHLVNPASGHPFVSARVHTLAGSIDIVIDPSIINGEPRIGGIVEGIFWLSARLYCNLFTCMTPHGR